MNVIMCPRCGGAGEVRNVGTLIDDGTSDSGSIGITIPFGGGNYNGVALRQHATTRMAQRLMPYTAPPGAWTSQKVFWTYAIVMGMSEWFIMTHWATELFLRPSWWVLALAMVPVSSLVSLVISPIFLGVGWMTASASRQRWNEKYAKLRCAYYCYRDDVVFDGSNHGSPEQYVPFIFNA